MLGSGTQLEGHGERAPSWWRWLVYSLGAALLLKLVALVAIKATFFSAAHEPEVTPRLVDEHLAVEPASQPSATEASR